MFFKCFRIDFTRNLHENTLIMWKFSKQFTARTRQDEETEINTVLEQIQTDNNIVFSGAKDALLWLVRNQAVKQEISPEKPPVIPEPEIVEVERKLGENEHIITFSTDQETILKAIAENRAKKAGKTPLQPADQVKDMAFQKHVLEDHWGNYYTGL